MARLVHHLCVRYYIEASDPSLDELTEFYPNRDQDLDIGVLGSRERLTGECRNRRPPSTQTATPTLLRPLPCARLASLRIVFGLLSGPVSIDLLSNYPSEGLNEKDYR